MHNYWYNLEFPNERENVLRIFTRVQRTKFLLFSKMRRLIYSLWSFVKKGFWFKQKKKVAPVEIKVQIMQQKVQVFSRTHIFLIRNPPVMFSQFQNIDCEGVNWGDLLEIFSLKMVSGKCVHWKIFFFSMCYTDLKYTDNNIQRKKNLFKTKTKIRNSIFFSFQHHKCLKYFCESFKKQMHTCIKSIPLKLCEPNTIVLFYFRFFFLLLTSNWSIINLLFFCFKWDGKCMLQLQKMINGLTVCTRVLENFPFHFAIVQIDSYLFVF